MYCAKLDVTFLQVGKSVIHECLCRDDIVASSYVIFYRELRSLADVGKLGSSRIGWLHKVTRRRPDPFID